MIRVFTIIAANYLPKACVLATSLKHCHPGAACHLVIADRVPLAAATELRHFDSVWGLEDLPAPPSRAWIFEHTLVELCTAVKAAAAQKLLELHGGHLFYLDPDIAVLGSLASLAARFEQQPILLTPHLTQPETTREGIIDNEMCALKHGIYNLGFVGVRASEPAHRFLDWWGQRLEQFCFDDPYRGLFTDQRWIDLAPAFFPELGIVHDPQYNVATWNLSHRRVAGQAPYQLTVEGRPLGFYHFSSIDAGGQEGMLQRYGQDSPVLWELRHWYLAECEKFGQSRLEKLPCVYNRFDDGTPVTRLQRWEYRHSPELRARFADPYATAERSKSYLHWWRHERQPKPGEGEAATRLRIVELEEELRSAQKALQAVRTSATWKIAEGIRRVAGPLSGLLKRRAA